MSAQAIRALLAQQAIANNLALHSRGVDRADFLTLSSAYHADATVAYGMFEGAAEEFARFLADFQQTLPATLHRTSNMTIRMTGDNTAISESYVIAYLETMEESVGTQRLVGGRYLDRHACKDGAWKIMHRTYVHEWNINQPSSGVWGETIGNMFTPRGAKSGFDPANTLLASWSAAHAAARNSPQPSDNSSTAGAPVSAEHTLARDVDTALSRQALHDLIMLFCRGMDRADGELVASVFHDDASIVAGYFNGPVQAFARDITQLIRANITRTFHSVANEYIQIDGDRAVGETYVITVTTTTTDGAEADNILGGRYVDRFERRNGVWKIAERVFVQDWNINQPTTASFDDAFYGTLKLRGGYKPNDPVYAFWPA